MRLLNDGNRYNNDAEKKLKRAEQKEEKKVLHFERKKRKKISDFLRYTEKYETENIKIGTCSVIGTRNEQQDSFAVNHSKEDNWVVSVVCDGMGGLSGGKIASALAADFVVAETTAFVRTKVDDGAGFSEIEQDNYTKQFLNMVKKANDMIVQLKDKNGENIKAGTTMTTAVIKNGMLHWVSVGDSKLYFMREGEIRCLTHEHNYAFYADKLEDDVSFKFNPNEREDALVSYLGVSELKCIDYNKKPLKLKNNDRILLCSDGLFKLVSDDEIQMIMKHTKKVEKTVSTLMAEAALNVKNSQDNTTVIVIEYKEK